MAFNHRFSFVRVSSNVKTGPIPVTMTARASCPDSCELKASGCYAESGNVRMHWQRLDNPEKGYNLEQLFGLIQSIPRGQLWRHNIAGDLTNDGQSIDPELMQTLINANKGRKGFTYTHAYDNEESARLILKANREGFTVNLSANSPEHADKLASKGLGPVVCLVPEGTPTHSQTPAGRPVITCPATRIESMDCAHCGLCAVADRKSIVAFPVHGASKRKAANVIRIYSKGG